MWIEVSISLLQIYRALAVQMEVTLVKLFYIEQPLRPLSVKECEQVMWGEKMQRVWHSVRVKI